MTVKHDGIIVHCAATQPQWMEDNSAVDQMKEIDKWHRDRGFRMIGYHYYISRQGDVVAGRSLGTMGAHAKGHNQTIGICLAGGFGSDADDLATDHYTAVQLAAAYDLIRKLQDQYQISMIRSSAITACRAKPVLGSEYRSGWLACHCPKQLKRNQSARNQPNQRRSKHPP